MGGKRMFEELHHTAYRCRTSEGTGTFDQDFLAQPARNGARARSGRWSGKNAAPARR
jgi:hypothetical protein